MKLMYRIVLRTPGAEKVQQYFTLTKGQAEGLLKQLLEAGQPRGTTYQLLESKEFVLVEGTVGEPTL